MKRQFIILMLFIITGSVFSQSRPIKRVFRKYNHIEGITSISIPGFVFKLASCVPDFDQSQKRLLRKVKKVKILTVEDEYWNKHLDLYDEMMDKDAFSGFNELIHVINPDIGMKLSACYDGNYFNEIVMLIGGDGNTLIYIKGKIKISDIKELLASKPLTNI